jgi:hypothetical protein
VLPFIMHWLFTDIEYNNINSNTILFICLNLFKFRLLCARGLAAVMIPCCYMAALFSSNGLLMDRMNMIEGFPIFLSYSSLFLA